LDEQESIEADGLFHAEQQETRKYSYGVISSFQSVPWLMKERTYLLFIFTLLQYSKPATEGQKKDTKNRFKFKCTVFLKTLRI
jgi:hypothetical protein